MGMRVTPSPSIIPAASRPTEAFAGGAEQADDERALRSPNPDQLLQTACRPSWRYRDLSALKRSPQAAGQLGELDKRIMCNVITLKYVLV